jgi:hypothetical protein
MTCGKRRRMGKDRRSGRGIEKIALKIDDLGRLDIFGANVIRFEFNAGAKIGDPFGWGEAPKATPAS